MTGKFTIRKVDMKDLPFLLEVYADSIRDIASRDYTPSQVEVWIKAGLKKSTWVHRVKNQYFIAAISNQNDLAGFASLELPTHIDLMYINPPFQGQGLASMLLRALIEKIDPVDRSAITVDASITARPFFEKKGFNVLHPNHHIIDGVPLVNFRMIYKVSPRT